MSKEIIIDGVNVAECRHLSFVEEDYCCDCQYEKYALCENSDCYYKQLKRLQAENEQMQKSFVSHSEFMNILENNPNINWEETAKENIYLINKYRKALEEIQKMFSEPCIEGENCFTCNSNCSNKDVLNITSEVLK